MISTDIPCLGLFYLSFGTRQQVKVSFESSRELFDARCTHAMFACRRISSWGSQRLKFGCAHLASEANQLMCCLST